MTDLELMKLHIEVLYQQNNKKQLTVVNEPPFEEAPFIFIGSTKEGRIEKYSEKVDDLLKKRLQNSIKNQPDDLIVGLINEFTNRVGLHEFTMGPAYVFPEIEQVSDEVIIVTEATKELLKDDFKFTFLDFKAKQPCAVMMKDERVVALCCSARQSNKAAEASVYTVEKYRGNGYGAAVTKAWAQQIQALGKVALYSTTWDNFASQGVARTLGLHQYGVDLSME